MTPRLLLVALLLVAQQPKEPEVKAVFLFNFAQFVNWPAKAQPAFTICVLGDHPLLPYLTEAVKGESVGGRPMVAQRLQFLYEAGECNILFFSQDARDFATAFDMMNQLSVLTVGESDGFAKNGGMIRFLSVGNKIRLRINVAAVKAAHLTISSQLLRAAELVDTRVQ